VSEQRLSIDYALAMADGVGAGNGPTRVSLAAEAAAFKRGHARLAQEVANGKLGFFKLPAAVAQIEACDRVVASHGPGIEDVLVLGIGGSSLGARAAVTALSDPLSGTALGQGLRLHFPDNSDPWLFGALLNKLNPKKTLALVVSKSGGTVETAAQMLCVRDWITQKLGGDALARHLIAITDPDHGSLRAFANEAKLTTLPIPANVGGRFCVLTAAGLLPLRLAGLDAAGLLRGAAQMAARCEDPDLLSNPAGVLAAIHVLHMRLCGHPMHVLLPYADALRPFAAWFVQLWAESLGKRVDRQGRVVEVGPTPIPAVGATDQHAQVQLFIEGPRDKLVTFIAVDERTVDVTIPKNDGDLSYLSGLSMGQLLDAERRGTALALARNGRPSLTIRIPRLDATQLGALFFLFEAATAYAGELLDIDAFDQPGVEEGKHLAFGLMGRKGYEKHKQAVVELEASLARDLRVS
jgi:glucose-6-phosphate isomerase